MEDMPAFQLETLCRRAPKLALASSAFIIISSIGLSRPIVAATITDLGTLGGPLSVVNPGSLNASGLAVGESTPTSDATLRHAFMYSAGVMTDLGTLGGDLSSAFASNGSGQIVGYSQVTGLTNLDHQRGNDAYHAFLYSGGIMADLGTLGGTRSQAFSINDHGQIVGGSTTTTIPEQHAFLYSGGVMNDLGTLGGSQSIALGINQSGQIVGYSATTGNLGTRGFLYSGGAMNDIGTLGGSSSYAYGLNDSGEVVGYSNTTAGTQHAFLYTGGAMVDLGTLGGVESYAYGVNNSGEIVGSLYSPGSSRAFLYSGGSMIDLNSLLPAGSDWSLNNAVAINDSGLILGDGFINGETHAFLLNTSQTDSPEPGSLILVGAALIAGLASCNCRRMH